MAVTSPTHRGQGRERPVRQRTDDKDERPAKRRADEHEAEGQADEKQARAPEESPEGEQPRSSMKPILGGTLAFVALAVYFIWLGKEMGGATPTGGAELAGIFAAIFVAVLALAGGALLGRNRD